MHTFAVVVFYIWIIGGQLALFVIPFRAVFKGASFGKGVLLTWGLSIVYYAISSIPFSGFIWKFAPELGEEVAEGNSLFASLIVGWFPGLIISFLAYMCRGLVDLIKKKSLNETKNT